MSIVPHCCLCFVQDDEDRYKEMLNRSDSENFASNYFKPKRANQLLGGEPLKGLGKTRRYRPFP